MRVIVVDDHSSDDSAEVIRDLASRFAIVQAVLLPRNGGASNARNVGFALGSSPWIAFLDTDDMWLPGAARALLADTAIRDADIIAGHFARVKLGGTPGEPECGWDGGDIRAGLASGGVISPSWSIVRRTTALDVDGFDPSFRNCNDWDFYTRAAAAGARFARIDKTVALYRTVPGDRLIDDHSSGAVNARRVLAHDYFADAR